MIAVERYYIRNKWQWDDVRNNLVFTMDQAGKNTVTISRCGVTYTQAGDGVYVNGYYKIMSGPSGYVWLDKHGNAARYDATGRLLEYDYRNRAIAKLVYNSSGTLSGVTDATDRQMVWYEYTNNTISAVHDLNNRRVEYGYDANSRLVSVKDAAGGYTYYEYDTNGKMTKKTDPAGRQTIASYDGSGLVNGVVDKNGTGQEFAFDVDASNGNSYCAITYTSGRIEEYWHDTLGNLVRKDVNGRTVKKVDINNSVKTITDELGNKTVETLDQNGNVLQTAYPNGTAETFTYEYAFNNVTSHTDTRGVATSCTYDTNGNMLTKTVAKGTPDERDYTYSYNDLGQQLTADAAGNADTAESDTTNTYDNNGNIQTAKDGEGNVTNYLFYDLKGNCLERVDARGNHWWNSYDTLGRLVVVPVQIDVVTFPKLRVYEF